MAGTCDMLYHSVLRTGAQWKDSPPGLPGGRGRPGVRGAVPPSMAVEPVSYCISGLRSHTLHRGFHLPGEGLQNQATGLDFPGRPGSGDGSPSEFLYWARHRLVTAGQWGEGPQGCRVTAIVPGSGNFSLTSLVAGEHPVWGLWKALLCLFPSSLLSRQRRVPRRGAHGILFSSKGSNS